MTSAELPALTSGEGVVDGSDENLWRNQNPSWVDSNGKVTSQLFKPTPKDLGCVSVARSTVVTAEAHFVEFTTELELASVGVWGVTVDQTVAEAKRRDLPIRCVDDHTITTSPRGHAYIDHRALSPNQSSKLGAGLRTIAFDNKRAHPPAED